MLNDTEIRNFMKSVVKNLSGINKSLELIIGSSSATDKARLKTKIDEILDYLDSNLHPLVSPELWGVYATIHDMVERLINDEND